MPTLPQTVLQEVVQSLNIHTRNIWKIIRVLLTLGDLTLWVLLITGTLTSNIHTTRATANTRRPTTTWSPPGTLVAQNTLLMGWSPDISNLEDNNNIRCILTMVNHQCTVIKKCIHITLLGTHRVKDIQSQRLVARKVQDTINQEAGLITRRTTVVVVDLMVLECQETLGTHLQAATAIQTALTGHTILASRQLTPRAKPPKITTVDRIIQEGTQGVQVI